MFARCGEIPLSAEATVSGQDLVATARGRLLMRGGGDHIKPSGAIMIMPTRPPPRDGALNAAEHMARQRG